MGVRGGGDGVGELNTGSESFARHEFRLFPLEVGQLDELMAREWCTLNVCNLFSPASYRKGELYLAGKMCQKGIQTTLANAHRSLGVP